MLDRNKDLNALFIIGAQRSGSTFLYHLLDLHPKIHMIKPVKPEPKLFLRKKMNELNNNFKINNPIISYIGEKATSYIEFPTVALEIKKRFPKAKIFVILRNPVDRAISNYKFTVDSKLETRTMHEVFFNKKPTPNYKNISVNPFNYVGRGFYTDYLKTYQDIFGHNLKVIILEQLLKESIESKIFKFLNLDHKRDYNFNKKIKINTSSPGDDINKNEDVRTYLYEVYKAEIDRLSTVLNIDLNKYWN